MTGHRTAATEVSEAAAGRRAGAPARPGSKWWTLVAVCLGIAILTRSAFTAGLNQILLVAAIIAFAYGLVSLTAIRGQDFVAQGPGPARQMIPG